MDTVLKQTYPDEWLHYFSDKNSRPDGRRFASVRRTREVVRNVLSRQYNLVGSASVSAGGTRVLVGISAEIAPPEPSTPKDGTILISVSIPPSCSVSISSDVALELAQYVTGALRGCYYPSDLSILPGLAVWILHVSAVIFELDGNGLDWLMAGCSAALKEVKLPCLKWDSIAQWWRMSNNPQDCEGERDYLGKTFKLIHIPLCATCVVFDDDKLLWDPSSKEESGAMRPLLTFIQSDDTQLRIIKRGVGGVDCSAILKREETRIKKQLKLMRNFVESADFSDVNTHYGS